jgi:peptidylprolyl isomerase
MNDGTRRRGTGGTRAAVLSWALTGGMTLAVAVTLAVGTLSGRPALATPAAPAAAPAAPMVKPQTTAEVLAASEPSDWQPLDPRNTLYMELPTGRVIILLDPQFAPHHVANVEELVRGGYFDGLWIMRAQENYVVQWGDPDATKPVGKAQRTLAAEFERPLRGLAVTRLTDPDAYAAEVGFVDGFPVAADPQIGRAWLVHCYGMVGAGRDNDVDSGGGTELYAVIGQAPRHLDRNVTLLGRVVSGMELLSVMARGHGDRGFYERPAERTTIRSVRIAADVSESERTALEALRTDTQTFAAYLEARRNRHEEWFKVPAGRIDVCNVPIPVRAVPVAHQK